MQQRRKKDRKAPSKPMSLEVLIGGRFMAWAGGFVIVMSIAALLALGSQQGWWGYITPELRCAFAACFGIGMLAGGEVALRKYGRMAAVGLFGGGLAVLYLTAHATTWASVGLLSDDLGFWLLALVALIGVAVTVRARLLSIGVLSVVAGYAVPFTVQAGSPFYVSFPLYLSMLYGIGLVLSGVLPQPFRPLRYVTLGAHAIVAGIWVVAEGRVEVAGALVFMCGWWGMISAEAVYAAKRKQSAIGNAIASLGATAWFITLTCWMFSSTSAGGGGVSWVDIRGVYTLAVGVLAAAMALQFGPGLDGLRSRPKSAMDKLAFELWCQTGILIPVAVALQFSDYGQSIAWLLIGIAGIEVGRRLPSRGLDVFGLIVGALGTAHVLLVDSWRSTQLLSADPLINAGWLHVTIWSVLAFGAVILVHVASHRLREGTALFWKGMPILLAVVGTIGWCWWWTVVGQGLTPTYAWLAGAVLLVLLRRVRVGLHYDSLSCLVLLATAARWITVDALGPRFASNWSPDAIAPFVNAQGGTALVIVAVGVWAIRALLKDGESLTGVAARAGSVLGQAWMLAGVVFILLAISIQVDLVVSGSESGVRSTGAGWSPATTRILWFVFVWGAGGCASAIAGALRPQQLGVVGRGGWLLLAGSALAWLTIGTIGPRVGAEGLAGPGVLINTQCLIGCALIGLLLIGAVVGLRRNTLEHACLPIVTGRSTSINVCVAWPLIAAIVFWLGTLEIDRFCAPEGERVADPEMARHTAWSVYWGLYSIGLVAVGFYFKARTARWIGLGLLLLTLLKVLTVDMAEVEMVYRVLSLMAVGLLLVGTSIAYAKLAPGLLAREQEREREQMKEEEEEEEQDEDVDEGIKRTDEPPPLP
ncbi:MAG: DUF2339 domain-containing protein [Planctomycetes bacterium]|nr:DUF2339 domain-containing protein [Planctomycetota bacterium]NOG54941.1 DUF2339 domain-containing protein [Planctomycetota bacterium]